MELNDSSKSERYINKRNYIFITIISAFAVIWGFIFPGSLSLSSKIVLLGVTIPIDLTLIFLLLLSISILFIGLIRDWTFHFGTYVTIKSREVLILGGILLFLNSFTFNGFDFIGFFVYYYELILITGYTLISLTYIPAILTAITGIIILVIGYLLSKRESSVTLYKLKLETRYSSTFLIGGVVIIVIAALLVTLYQPSYVGSGIGSSEDRILSSMRDLPFPTFLINALKGFYLDMVIFLYPLVIFICSIFILKWSLELPSHRIFKKDFIESMDKFVPKIRRLTYLFSLLTVFLIVILFGSIALSWFIRIDTASGIFTVQTLLFKNGVGLFGLSLILLAIQFGPKVIKPFLDSRILRYAARRVLAMIPMFIGISIISYSLMASTGNPVQLIISRIPQGRNRDVVYANLMKIYGLNSPVQSQWFNWFSHFIMGDLGNSIIQGDSVSREIGERIIPTLELAIPPLILAVLIALPLGIYAALRQYSWQDNSIAIFASFGLAIPIFLLILLLIIGLSYFIPIFPPSGRAVPIESAPGVNLIYVDIYFDTFIKNIISWRTWDGFFHMVIPVIAITSVSLALYVRLVRSGYLEVVQQDYILSAQAYGFEDRTIIFKHALRNVLIPIVTFLGLSVGGLLGGAPLTETTLSWPGLGAYGIVQILAYDYPVVMGLIMVTALLILIANLFTDLLYSMVDPRVAL